MNAYVPLTMTTTGFEKRYPEYIQRLKEAKVTRVYLCPGTFNMSEEEKQAAEIRMRKYIPAFEEAGCEVGIWINSLGHPDSEIIAPASDPIYHLPYMETCDGTYIRNSFCPYDAHLAEVFGDWIARIASCGAKMIMLDDDYRMNFRGKKLLCCCDRHRAQVEKLLGRPVTRQEMGHVFDGEPGDLRDAWQKVQGEGLVTLAKSLRKSLDAVNPQVRLGHCSVLSTWDLDGVDNITLARAFAGSTKPFLRTIGAPYWNALKHFEIRRLSTVMEYERMQEAWCRDSGVEIFAEGDVCPRPRWMVPANYLELFDAALRVNGGFDGILKYMCDYSSDLDYEPGYLQRHIRHEGRRQAIDRMFGGKKNVGMHVFEPMKTLAYAQNPHDVHDRCVPSSLRLGAFNGIATCFEGDGVHVIFGDAAYLAGEEQLKNGAICDIKAAKILQDRGFDLGIAAFGEPIPGMYVDELGSTREYFDEYGDHSGLGGDFRAVELKPGAVTLSHTEAGKPCSFRYENAAGQRFLVYTFRGETSIDGAQAFGSYYRQKQLADQLPWLGQKPFPALCLGNPYLYLIAKEDESSLSVALFNCFEDEAIEPRVKLGKAYDRVEALECTAQLIDGQTVQLSDIAPFGFAAFTVKK